MSRQTWVLLITVPLILSLVFVVLLNQSDHVILSNTSGSENGILVSGQTGGMAVSFLRFPTSATADFDIGRFQASPGDNLVAAFTESRPPAVRNPTTWTIFANTVNLPFSAQILIPVTVWIVDLMNVTTAQAGNLCVDTAAFWSAERMGVGFSACNVQRAPDPRTASGFLAFDCAKKANIQRRIGKTPNRINIYIVNAVEINGADGTGKGTACLSSAAPNDFVAIGRTARPDLLAHELGHTFELVHIDRQTDFNDANVMHSDSAIREFFSEGQLFRAHVSQNSSLNAVYSARPGQPAYTCPSLTPGTGCPPLEKRIWADGALPPN